MAKIFESLGVNCGNDFQMHSSHSNQGLFSDFVEVTDDCGNEAFG